MDFIEVRQSAATLDLKQMDLILLDVSPEIALLRIESWIKRYGEIARKFRQEHDMIYNFMVKIRRNEIEEEFLLRLSVNFPIESGPAPRNLLSFKFQATKPGLLYPVPLSQTSDIIMLLRRSFTEINFRRDPRPLGNRRIYLKLKSEAAADVNVVPRDERDAERLAIEGAQRTNAFLKYVQENVIPEEW